MSDVTNDPESQLRKVTHGHGWHLGAWIAWLPAVLVVLPMMVVMFRVFEPGAEAWQHVVDHLLFNYIWQTLLLIVTVVILTFVMGIPTAWWMATCQFPCRSVMRWALVLPLAVPGYVSALAYFDATEALVPMYVWFRINVSIEAFLLVQEIAKWFFAVLVLSATLFPYVYLTAYASFTRQASSALEAARILGVGPWKVFRLVAIPMARPALVAGGSLVAFEAMNDYGVTNFFGVQSLTVGVFRAWLSEGHLHIAIRLALILLVFSMGSLFFEKWLRGRRGYTEGSSGDRYLTPRPVSWGKGLMVLLGCMVPLTFGFLFPAWRLMNWAIEVLAGAYQWQNTWDSTWHSFALAGGVSVLIGCVAFMIVAVQHLTKAKHLKAAQFISLSGYALPSALVAVGIGALFSYLSRFPGLSWLALSATVAGVVYAYYVRFLAIGLQPVDAGFKRISSSFHEVSRTLGVGPWRTLLRVDLPLIWPSLLAGMTLAFVDIFKELTLILVLRPFDFETLATQIVRLTDESRIPEASVPALILVSLSLLGLIPLIHFSTQKNR